MSLSFLSKENPLIANIKKGKFLTPWFLAPFILYYITEYMSPVSTASTSFFSINNTGSQTGGTSLTSGPSSIPSSPSSFGFA